MQDNGHAFRKFLADRFGFAPRSEEEAKAATAEISRDPRMWGPNPGEFKARLDSLLGLEAGKKSLRSRLGQALTTVPGNTIGTANIQETLDATQQGAEFGAGTILNAGAQLSGPFENPIPALQDFRSNLDTELAQRQGIGKISAFGAAERATDLPTVSLDVVPGSGLNLPGDATLNKVDVGVKGALELAGDPLNFVGGVPKAGKAVKDLAGSAEDLALRVLPEPSVLPQRPLPPRQEPTGTFDRFTPNSRRVAQGKPIQRGKRALIERMRLEGRLGRFSQPDEMDDAARFVQALPDEVVRDLGSSFRATAPDLVVEEAGRSVGGLYNPEQAIINIYRDVADNYDPVATIAHEIAHHAENFVPESDLTRLRSVFEAEKAAKAGELKLGRDKYRYTSFEEWFAEVISDKAVRDLYEEPAVRNALQRVSHTVRGLAIGTRNWLQGRGFTDQAEAVYRDIVQGKNTTQLRNVNRQRFMAPDLTPEQALEAQVARQVPPTPPAAAPPAGTVPPQPPVPPAAAAPQGPSEIARSLRQAEAMVAQDTPGRVSGLVDKIPGMEAIRDWERPGRKLPKHILTAHVAENSARQEVAQELFSTRMPLLQKIDEVFGEGAKTGAKVNVRFLGTAQQAQNPITGTFKDIADNPDLYDLSPAQKQVLADIEARNNTFLARVNTGYGTKISQFQPKPEGAFLPNVDVSDDALQAIEDFYGNPVGTRAVASGRSQERFYQTARDRMAADRSFKPQTDVAELIRGLDQSKANAASGEVFRAGVGGLSAKPTANTAVAHGYKPVELGGEVRWFPPDEAAAILRLREQAAKTGPKKWFAEWQATVLSSDFSPITIQGMQQFFFHPRRTAEIVAKGNAAFAPDSLAKLVAQDPQGWRDFAFATGRSISEPAPGEFGTGLVAKIPKVGPALSSANDRMYNFVMSAAKNHFDDDVKHLTRQGLSHDEAIAVAGDHIQRIVPSINPTRYGLSPAEAQVRRLPLTSVSFVRKSGELLMDATRGYAKIASVKGARSLTPKERLAVYRVTQAAAFTTTLSVTSAVIEAQRTGQDPVQAAQDAINPGSPRFMSLVVLGKRVPLGGPLRALFKAVAPQDVSGVPFPIPFGGMARYLENRIAPGISTIAHGYANRDFSGRQIYRRGQDSGLVTAAKLAAYAAENVLPATGQEVAGDIRTGEVSADTAVRTAGNIAGQNISPLRTRTDLRNDFAGDLKEYNDLPTNPREAKARGMPTREKYREENPEADARLFVTGVVSTLQTEAAKMEAVRLMQEYRLTIKDIPGLEVQKYESDERTALRKYFEKQLGIKSKSQPKTNTSPTSPTKTKSGSSFDQALQGAGGSPRKFIGK